MTSVEEDPGLAPVVGGVPTDLEGPSVGDPPEPDARAGRQLPAAAAAPARVGRVLRGLRQLDPRPAAAEHPEHVRGERGHPRASPASRSSSGCSWPSSSPACPTGSAAGRCCCGRSSGYTVFTALTAISWDIWSFAFFQFASRVFLGAEYAIGVTMIVEEFPAAPAGPGPRHAAHVRRRSARSPSASCSASGCRTPRSTGGPSTWSASCPLLRAQLLPPPASRRPRRFVEVQGGPVADAPKPLDARAVAAAYRRNLVLVGLVHMFRSIPLFGSTAWWAFYAERERGFTSAEVAFYIICAYGLGCVGYYVCGRAMERFGRRPTGARLRRRRRSPSRSCCSRRRRRRCRSSRLLLARVLRARHGAR